MTKKKSFPPVSPFESPDVLAGPYPSRSYLKPPDGAIPSKAKITILHCRKCGVTLINEFRHLGFDSNNGKELFAVKSICPNRRNWIDGHDNYDRNYYTDEGRSRLRVFYEDGTEA